MKKFTLETETKKSDTTIGCVTEIIECCSEAKKCNAKDCNMETKDCITEIKECSSVYVHIPFCKARCGYCAFSSCTNFTLQQQYFDVLCEEISAAPIGCKIHTMFWGGGTPSAVEQKYLQKLYDALFRQFDFSELVEFTVECNPESTTFELLQFFKKIGVNRLSFGLQSANDQTLKRIGRLHNFQSFCDVLHLAYQCGFENINADLILDLPESQNEFLHTVDVVSKLPLQHISLYALEIHDENVSFKKLCEKYKYSEDQLADMYDSAVDILRANGFVRYEVSNFAKIGCECKHNCVYWTENRYFGFGAAASGFVGNVRYGNAFDIKTYLESNAEFLEYCEKISRAEEMTEFVMLGLRLAQGISLQEFECRFGGKFEVLLPNCVRLLENGFLKIDCGRVFVPCDKTYVLNSILVELLPD